MSRTKAELIAIERDGETCRRCGKNLWEQVASLHHRQPRGAGGGDPRRYDRPSNLVVICGSGTTGCHGMIESRRKIALATGWLVPRYRDPELVPLIDTSNRTIMLNDDGTYVVDAPFTDYWPDGVE